MKATRPARLLQCPNISTGSRNWMQRNDENWVVILVGHLPVQQVDVCEMVDTHRMQVWQGIGDWATDFRIQLIKSSIRYPIFMEIHKVPWGLTRELLQRCKAHFNPRYCKEETMPNLEEFKRSWVKGSARSDCHCRAEQDAIRARDTTDMTCWFTATLGFVWTWDMPNLQTSNFQREHDD